jgi:23S rRNA (uracil1939-C5)-methyltransferase
VLECEAQKIVYVSCNPTTLAPNAVQLKEAGYRLARVRPVDMFPQTPHIECVALFERTERRLAAPGREAEEAATDV